MSELTRRDRLAATARLDELAEEIAQIARWLDKYGDDADKGAVLAECAACWLIKPADHSRPEQDVVSRIAPGPAAL